MKKHVISVLLLSIFIIPSFVLAQATDTDPNGPVSSCVSITNNLRYKTRDANVNGDVSTLQDFLQSQNYLNSEPTGYFGLLTMQAVKAFQKANGISPTGFVGPATRAKIALLTCDGNIPTLIVPVTPITYNPCPKGAVYSLENGKLCDTKTNFPPGCFSTSGFSSTTGESCGGTSVLAPLINSFGASPSVINIGQATTLDWYSSNTVGCYFGNNGPMGTGSDLMAIDSKIFYPQTTTTYTLHCYNKNGWISNPMTQTVTVNPASTCSTSGFDPLTGFRCGCSSINGYSSTTGLACGTESNFPVGCFSTSGFSTTTGEYCDGSHPQTPTNLDPTVWLHANDKDATTIESGQAVKLTWGSTNAPFCYGPRTSVETLAPSGYVIVYPTQSTEYSIKCYQKIPLASNDYGFFAGASVAVTVRSTTTSGGGTNITAPTISISPTSGPVGTVVTVSGTGFADSGNSFSFTAVSPLPGYSSATFSSGSSPASFAIPSTVSQSSEAYTEIRTVPTVPGQYNIGLSNKNGKSNVVSFTVTDSGNSHYTMLFFSASKSSVASGGGVALSLNAYYASSCQLYADGNLLSWQPSGTFPVGISYFTTVYPTNTTIYKADCVNSSLAVNSGSLSGHLLRVVTTPSLPPSVDLKINGSDGPITISSGQSISGSWTTRNVGACVFYDGNKEWSGVEDGVGSFSTISSGHPLYPTIFPKTFTVTCKTLDDPYLNPTAVSVSDNVIINSSAVSTAPNKVSGLSAQYSGGNSINLNWSVVTVGSGQSPIGVYNIYRSLLSNLIPDNTTNSSPYLIAQGNVLSYTDTGLAAGNYYYRVAASDINGLVGSASTQATASVYSSPTQPVNDPYSSTSYDVTSSTPLSNTEKTVTYTYSYSPCGSLMTIYTSPGSVSVGSGPVYSSSLAQCTGGTIPDTSTYRTYACKNNFTNGYLQGTATFAFQCKNSISANVLDAFNSIENIPLTTGLMPNSLSLKFKIGDKIKVKVIGNLNVRSGAGVNAKSLGGQPSGVVGAITDGPKVVNGQSWWKVDYAYAQDGWSTENYLELQK